MGGQKLAVQGGPPTFSKLASRLPLRWYQLRRGLSRSFDLLRMLKLTATGRTSVNRGGVVQRFEEAFQRVTGARYALAMNSGTAALHSAYFAVGVGPGTEVIVPSYTWHASATPVLLCGAVPVFCEIDPETLNIDVDDMERRITERTRAICVLHAWGNPAPMDRIMEVANRQGIHVIEDCSHAHGSTYQGRSVGTFGDVGCFSLQASKTIDGGEAGVAITRDARLFDRMVLLGHNFLVGHGGQKAGTFPFDDISLGVKYRPHAAAMYFALCSLRTFEKRNRTATRSWNILCAEFQGVRGIRPIPTTPGGVRGGYYSFVLEYEGEDLGGPPTDEFVRMVQKEGAPLQLDQFRNCLLHTVPLFRELDRSRLGGCFYDPTRPWEEQVCRAELPVTERITRRLVRFPRQFNGISGSYVRRCAAAVKKVLAGVLPSTAPVGTQDSSALAEGVSSQASGAR